MFFSQDLHICLLASEASVQSHHEDVNSSNELNFLVICNYDAHDPDNLFKQGQPQDSGPRLVPWSYKKGSMEIFEDLDKIGKDIQ